MPYVIKLRYVETSSGETVNWQKKVNTLGELYRYSMNAPAAGQTIVCMLDPEGKEITEAEIKEVLRQEAILRMRQTNY
jgi:hypothetical protein